MRVTVAACALATIGVLGAGCSVGKTSNPVSSAANATTKAGTARFTVEETQNDNGQSSTIKGAGVLNRTVEASDIIFASEQLGGSAVSAPYEFEEIVKNGLVYFRDPSQALPPGKTWVRLTPTELAGLAGPSSGTSTSTGYDPNAFLDKLASVGEAAPWKTIGTETVNGVPAVHYHATLDVKAALAKQSGDLTKAQQQIKASAYGTATFVYDVWVGKSDKRIRKLAIQVGGATAATRMSMVYAFSDYGAPLAVNKPPATQTIGLQALNSLQ